MNKLEDYMDDLGFTVDDLKEPEQLMFTAKEQVRFFISDVTELNRPAKDDKAALHAIILKTKVMGSYEDEHTGKLYDIFINKAFKDTFIKFLRGTWTVKELEEAIKNKTLDYTRLVGTTMVATPATGKNVGDKVYQNFYGWNSVNPEDIVTDDDISDDVDFS
jgi:hypothetical protein